MGVRILFVLVGGSISSCVPPGGFIWPWGGDKPSLVNPNRCRLPTGGGGVGNCMIRGSASASSMPSAKR